MSELGCESACESASVSVSASEIASGNVSETASAWVSEREWEFWWDIGSGQQKIRNHQMPAISFESADSVQGDAWDAWEPASP